MLNMSSQVENIVNAYKTLAKIPSISGAKLNNAGSRVSARWSVRNLDKGRSTKSLFSYELNDSFDVVGESDFGVDVSNELLSAVSPRETFKAVIREEKNGKDSKKQYLEVWRGVSLAHSIDLTALDLHGDVYADSEFGSLDWTRDETAIVYVAEKKPAKSEPYIKRKAPKDAAKTDAGGETPPPKKGEEYVYRQDWGEQLVGKHLSVIVVCKLADESLTVLEGLPDSWCPGQIRFAPDGNSVVGVAWETEPRRLGLIFCTNRPSYIFTLTLDGKMTKLSGEGLAVRSPRFSPGGERLAWLQRGAGGPHHACHALVTAVVGDPTVSTIIDVVQTSVQTANSQKFTGVYSQSLPGKCFSSDSKRIVFTTPQEMENRSYVVDIDGARLVDISNRSVPGSTSVLDVRGDKILAVCSNYTTPGQLYVAKLPPQGQEGELVWKCISKPLEVPDAVSTATVEYLHLEHDSSDSVRSFTALYIAPRPAESARVPLVVWPHGGPHSGYVNAYSLETALFLSMGVAALHVNYRGSTGAGQASVDFLPQRVGTSDVLDCRYATEVVVKRFPVDESKLALFGGSHGGFLVAHLSGQYPDVYKAVVSRNPVIDIASMINSTDIADWCAVEAGLTFTEQGPVSEEHLLQLRRCSPIAHVHRVTAPTALMLGSVDKRVPFYQGLEYYRRLKANGVTTKLYMYEDNHSLSSQPAEMDNLINSLNWFCEHLQ